MIRNSRVTGKPDCSGSTNFDENMWRKTRASPSKGERFLCSLLKELLWGEDVLYQDGIFTVLSQHHFLHTSCRGRNTLLSFWAFSSSNRRDLLGSEGRVEVNGSFSFFCFKNYFCSFAKRKESPERHSCLVSKPTWVWRGRKCPGDRD